MSLNCFLLIKGFIHIFGSVGGAINHPFLLFVMVNVPLFCLSTSSVFGMRQSLLSGVDVFLPFFISLMLPLLCIKQYHVVLFSGKDHDE